VALNAIGAWLNREQGLFHLEKEMRMQEATKTSAFAVEKFLKGIDFPCTKNDLLDHAKKQNAPDSVIKTIQNMPDEEFSSANDVMKAFGKVSK